MATKKKAAVVAEAAGSFEELAAQNLKELTAAVKANSKSMDILTSKFTSLACHVTALEALLSEVVKITGVDLVQVNSLIRSRIKSVDGNLADSNVVVDIAAALATPATRRT